jgi:hypothetical protein
MTVRALSRARAKPRPTAAGVPPEDPDSPLPAGLRFAHDDGAGIKRLRAGKGMRYEDASGGPVRDISTLARIKALAIPPAWTDVWICPWPNGHIQATGRDGLTRRYMPRKTSCEQSSPSPAAWVIRRVSAAGAIFIQPFWTPTSRERCWTHCAKKLLPSWAT